MKQILLLEDLPEIRAWLKALALQVFPDAQISEASRIHDALELVNAVRFDVAMLDLGLPDGSGVEVVQALREKQPEAQSVVVTIHEDDDHLFPALQAGALATCSRSSRASSSPNSCSASARVSPRCRPRSPAA